MDGSRADGLDTRGVRNAPLRLSLAALLAALASTGCHATLQKNRFILPNLSVSAILVEPFGFRWVEPAYRPDALAERLLATADAKVGRQALLFGPQEFKVYRAEDNGWAATNAIALLPPARLKPENALLLRAWAEKRVTSSRRETLDAKGRAVGTGAVEDVTYIGHVELVHPSTQRLAVEVVGEAVVDPFAEKRPEDEADPAPDLTKLMEKLTAEAMAELEGHLAPPAPARELPFSVAFVPPPPEASAAPADPLEAELLRQNLVRFENPGLSEADATRLARLPGGLAVTQAQAGSPLKPGDSITQIEDAPALPQTLQRARFRDGVVLKVRRADGTVADVVL